MNKEIKSYVTLTATIFIVIGVVHAARFFFQWPATICGWPVPLWVSALAVLVAAYVVFRALRLSDS